MNMLDGMQIDSKDRHGAVDTYDIDPRTLLTSDRARRSAANRLLEVYGYSNEIGEADLHDFLVCSTLPTRRNKQHRITVTYAQIASGEVEVKW